MAIVTLLCGELSDPINPHLFSSAKTSLNIP